MSSLSLLRNFGNSTACRRLADSKKYNVLSRPCSSLRHSGMLMKAVCIEEFGGANVLKIKRIPIPRPSSSEVLVRVKAAGINPVDTYIREGEFMVLPKLPAVLGKEASGVIEEVGPDVGNLKVGDRVVCCLPWNGGYAEYVACAADNVFTLSDRLNFAEGGALYVAYFTAYRALVTLGRVKKGESLLVHGASGAVGLAAVQIAKSKGLTVVGSASSDEGRRIVESAGADYVFNHNDEGSPLRSSAGDVGFDIILETCAHLNLDKDLLLLKQNGRVAIVGSRGPIEINPRSLIYTEGNVFGVKLLAVTQEDFRECVDALTKGADDGWLRPVIAKEYDMSWATQAHEDLIDNTGARGKLVFVM